MNAIDLLNRQHRALEAALRAAQDAETAKRGHAVTRLADDLGKHMTSEEQVFYPAVRAHRTEDILLESLEEHLSLKRLLADLLELDPEAETWAAKLKVLDEQTRHHHREEEDTSFQKFGNAGPKPNWQISANRSKNFRQHSCAQGRPARWPIKPTRQPH